MDTTSSAPRPRHFLPSSDLGRQSLQILGIAVVVGFVPIVGLLVALPLGVAAMVQAVRAVIRHHDRGVLLALPLVIGTFPALFVLGEILIQD